MSATYAYRIRNPAGELLEGQLRGASIDEVARKLRQGGGRILQLAEDLERPPDSARVQPAGDLRRGARPSRKALLGFFGQLAIMVDTGCNLAGALETLAAECPCPRLAVALAQVARDEGEGRQLSEALARWPRAFTPLMIHLVRAGEVSGHLPEMLQRLEHFLQRDQETRARVRGALAYPAIMAFVAISVVVFLIGYVLPKFKDVFRGHEAVLPLPTRLLLALGETVEAHGWALGLGALALIVLALLFWRHPRGREACDAALLRLPIFGALVRITCVSRTLRALGVMLRGGVGVLEAIGITEALAGHMARPLDMSVNRTTRRPRPRGHRRSSSLP